MRLCRSVHSLAARSTAPLRAIPITLRGRPRAPVFSCASKATKWKCGFAMSLPALSWIAATKPAFPALIASPKARASASRCAAVASTGSATMKRSQTRPLRRCAASSASRPIAARLAGAIRSRITTRAAEARAM